MKGFGRYVSAEGTRDFEHYVYVGDRWGPNSAKAGFNITEREPEGMFMGYKADVEVVRAPSGKPLHNFEVILNGPGTSKAKRKVSRALATKYSL